MPKIESIRPGGALEATLSTYPLAELLLGILRGNLTGRLELFLHPEPRNFIVFKDGVPVSVQLPDSGVSLVKILIDSGELPHDRGLDLLRVAEASGRNEEAVIQQHNVLSAGALDEARRRRARAQVVRLFDAGPLDFRFTEGGALSADMPLTILQPLPVVFEGLFRAEDDSVVGRFLESHGRSVFELSGTYPKGVDPFEWGSQVERIVNRASPQLSVARLAQGGLPQDLASVVLTSLFLADMLDLREQGPGLRPAPGSSGDLPPARLPEPRRTADPTPSGGIAAVSSPNVADLSTPPAPAAPGGAPGGGLVIHRRSGTAQSVHSAREKPGRPGGDPASARPAAAPAPAPSPVAGVRAPAASSHDQELQAVRQRIGPIAGQSYYQLLRVTPGSTPEQVERAYRFLLRRVAQEGEDPGWRATKDLLREAYEVLRDPPRASRYADIAARAEKSRPALTERQAFEAEPKVDRTLHAMASGHTGEAAFLLMWAEKLDPSRTDVPVLHAVLDFVRAPRGQRGADAKALQAILAQELARQPHDWRLKVCQALVLAELSDARGAQALLLECPEADHPMARLVRSTLDGDAP